MQSLPPGTLGYRIRQLRKQNLMSQKLLASLCKLSQVKITQLETGILNNPTLKTLRTLAAALNVTLAELLTGVV